MKNTIMITLIITALLHGLPTLAGPGGDVASTSRCVAEVNGSPITSAELTLEIETSRNRFIAEGMAIEELTETDLSQQALDRLINAELLYLQGLADSIDIDEDAIVFQIESIKKQFQSEDEFNRMLKSIGFSPDDMRRHVVKTIMVEKVVEKRSAGLTPAPEEEIRAYYDDHPDQFTEPERVRVSHILVAFDPEGSPAEKVQAQRKIKEVRANLQQGKDFATIAAAFSDCPSREKGGDLGFFGRGEMEEPFEKAAFALEPGRISDIVMTSQGFHILQLTAKMPETLSSYEDVKASIAEFLKTRALKADIDRYVRDLREAAQIHVYTAPATVTGNDDPVIPDQTFVAGNL